MTEIDIHTHTALSDAEAVVRHADGGLDDATKPATGFTRQLNAGVAERLGIDLDDASNSEYEVARAHLVRPADTLEILDDQGRQVWNVRKFDFLKDPQVPATVNPSLWVHAKSDRLAGLFEVVPDTIYQVRGFDISNLTLVKSKTGWIVLDVLTTTETARAALKFAEEGLNADIANNIRAILISHSHADHFGGIEGIIASERIGCTEDGLVPIYAPAGFLEEAVSENVYAGTAMSRRSDYQFGTAAAARAHQGSLPGLSQITPKGTVNLPRPTHVIDHDQTIVIDGVEVFFQLTPGTEAPAEMNNYFPQFRALWLADNTLATLHNLYPIRGAQVRDAKAWVNYILDLVHRFGAQATVAFQAHEWPHENTAEQPNAVREYLLNTAAVYKYIHDQTLHLANQGYTADEIGRRIEVPDQLLKHWYIRPYYGSVEINAHAVYNRYLGYFNGNPINLFPLAEEQFARKFVEYGGSADQVLQRAQADFDAGDYQWAAYAANQVVFTDPDNQRARYLAADALEQLGYQSEPSIWRNAYLQGAEELRHGVDSSQQLIGNKGALLSHVSVESVLDYLAISLDGQKAASDDFELELTVEHPDTGQDAESYLLYLRGGALLYHRIEGSDGTRPHATLLRSQLGALIAGRPVPVGIERDAHDLLGRLQGYLVNLAASSRFNIIEP